MTQLSPQCAFDAKTIKFMGTRLSFNYIQLYDVIITTCFLFRKAVHVVTLSIYTSLFQW